MAQRTGLSFAGLLAVACGATACSSSSPSGGGGGGSPSNAVVQPDQTNFQTTWKPDTIVLDAATVQAKLRNPTATDGAYQFDPSTSQLASAQPGQALVLTGVGLVKIDSVTPGPDAIAVATEPASLLDAVTDANVSWDIAADFSQPLRTQDFARGLRLLSGPATACEESPDSGPCLPTAMFSGTLGNLQASESLTENADGSLTAKCTLTFPQQGSAVLSVVATAVVHTFREQGSVVIQASSLTNASLGLQGLDVDLDLNVGAVALSSSDATFKFPVEITFPFELGPLPAYFKLGLGIDLNSTLTSNSSARSHLHYHVGGSGTLQVQGTSASGTGMFDSLDGTPPSVMDTETVSTVTAGFGTVINWPQVTFGVGAAKIAAAEAYLTGKEEAVINETVNLNGLGLIAGNCQTVDANVGLFAGGNLQLAGIVLKQEKQIYGATRQVLKGGNPDISQCP